MQIKPRWPRAKSMEGTPLLVDDDIADKESRRHKETAEKPETRKSRAKKPEAIGLLAVETNPEPAPTAKSERIGHMLLVSSEAKPETPRHEVPAETTASPGGKRIDTLSRAELMTLSEKITIDGSNLRQIYETHLIGERGLRRLVAEHLSGGDLRKALRQEVLEREMDFERDPAMRDLASSATAPATGGNAALDKLLQKAAISVADSGEEAAFFKARARYEAVHQQQHHRQQRRVIDIGLSVIIASLVLLVIIMYLTRR